MTEKQTTSSKIANGKLIIDSVEPMILMSASCSGAYEFSDDAGDSVDAGGDDSGGNSTGNGNGSDDGLLDDTNTTLVGGTENNSLNGRDGIDTAIFDGNFAEFKVSNLGGGLVELRCDYSVDIVSNVELFTFKDGTVSFADLLAGRGPNFVNVITGTVG